MRFPRIGSAPEESHEKRYRDVLVRVAVALSLLLAVLPAAAQTNGIQRVRLDHREASQLGGLLFGPGVAEVPTLSTGTTTAGGTVSWVKYLERDDGLGMHHVYYHQQYHHPQLGRSLRVLGTAVSLHYAPDGSLRRANLAQVTDVPPLPQVTITAAQQAFNATQVALASRPGFALGIPDAWPPGALSQLLDSAELSLVTPSGANGYRLQWRLTTLDATLFPWNVVVDATDGSLVSITPGAAAGCWPYPTICPECQGQNPEDVLAKAKPESEELLRKNCGDGDDWCFCGPTSYSCDDDGLRHVAANACSTCAYYRYLDEPQESCGGDPCTHEAVREADDGIPQIEVYQGMNNYISHLHCGYVGGQPSEGKYMRLGLKEQGGHPFYGAYGLGGEGKGLSGPWVPHTRMRRQAGDAMFNTLKTMEQLKSLFDWCGVTNNCNVAVRIVVDQMGGSAGSAWFNAGPYPTWAPIDAVYVDRATDDPPIPPWPDRAQTAALDIIAHEWGHGVDKYGSAKFISRCSALHPEVCQMKEGLADVIGHVVEHESHVTQGVLPDEDDFANHLEQKDWVAGEDWDSAYISDVIRRADMYDEDHSCPDQHYSVHADDQACEPQDAAQSHTAGNRLAVVLRLLAEGDAHPACSYFGNCDLVVDGIGLEAAAKVLFRVLVIEADQGTVDWDELPYLARGAVRDLFSVEDCPAIQQSVFDAFEAVGYPQAVPRPCIMCGPIQACPPCCPPPCCDEQQEE